MAFARQTNSPDTVLVAADISTSALEMLADAQRFMMSGNNIDYKAIKSDGQIAADKAQGLGKQILDESAAGKMKAASDSISNYLELADQLAGMTNQRKEIEAKTLEDAGTKLVAELDVLTKMIVANQATLGADADAGTTTTNVVLSAISGVAVLLGLIMAVVLGRWLSGTIRRMAKDMERLAAGDLDLELKGASRRDELGMMGKALEVFRTNGLAIRSNDAQKEAAARASAEAHQKAMALQAAVAEVVGGAVRGDFSARVPEAFVASDESGFARSLNEVMGSVERGV